MRQRKSNYIVLPKDTATPYGENMKTLKYILTKHETIRRTEKVEYVVKVPMYIKNKAKYAYNKLYNGGYESCEVIDIVDSEMLDDEFIGLKKAKANSL